MKRFDDGSAIPISSNIMNPEGISASALLAFRNNNAPSLSSTLASVMPRWIRAVFFDPETERSRIEVNDYQSQQTGAKEMRKMTGCRLLDSIEIPLKKLPRIGGLPEKVC